MNIRIIRHNLVTVTGLLALAGIFGCLILTSTASATTITNNVSVSSNGSSNQSSAVVKTTINGETVEDYDETSTGSSISYSSYITADDDDVVIETNLSTTAPTSTEAQLQSLLDQLLTLLSLYVSNHS